MNAQHTPGPFTVDLVCKGLHAYSNPFDTRAEAISTADAFALHKGTHITVKDASGAIVHTRAAITKATGGAA